MLRQGGMAFDGVGNRLIMFGGLTQTPGSITADTWSYNGNWSLLSSVSAPARWGHRLVRNPLSNRIVMFGGRSPDVAPLANDTYEWTGSAWSAVPTPTAPTPRYLYGMCFDSTRGVVVLFGGRSYTTTLSDTWEYNGITWVQRTTATTPPARTEMVFVDDPSTGGTLLFGGYNPDTQTLLGDTWRFNGVDWQALAPAASPSARYRAAAIYDSVRQRPVLYGGFNGTAIVTDTHEWDGASWYQVASGTAAPTNATENFHAFDSSRRKFVVFGGFGGSFSNATSEYTGANTGLFSRFGSGCAAGLGVPTIDSTLPTIGTNMAVTFGNIDTDTEIVLAVYGLSRTTWNALPLPFDLAPIGLPGCDLLVSADVVKLVPTTAGVAVDNLAIPNQTALINRQLFVQGILLDLLTVDFAFTGTTQGGRAVIGG